MPLSVIQLKSDHVNELREMQKIIDMNIFPEVKELLNMNHYATLLHFIAVNIEKSTKVMRLICHKFGQKANVQPIDLYTSVGFINKFGYAYVLFPIMPEENIFAKNNLHKWYRIIKELNNSNHKGWIIDLRGNTGGVIEYYVSALMVFVDDFRIKSENKDGEITSIIECDGEKYKFTLTNNSNDSIEATLPIFERANKAKIHLLIDCNTASSAEITTIILMKFANAISYGMQSHGILTTVDLYETSMYSIEVPGAKIICDGYITDGKVSPNFAEIPQEFYPNLI